jgi:hypothetical protein
MQPYAMKYLFCIFFGCLECVCHYFANVAHFVFMKDVCIRTQRAAVAGRRATNLATHLHQSCMNNIGKRPSFFIF